MVFVFAEAGDGRELIGVFGGQAELAVLPGDYEVLAIGFDPQAGVGSFSQNRVEPTDGEHGAAGGIDLHAGDLDAHADLQVGGHEDGGVTADFELDILQDGLGAATRSHGGRGLKGGKQLLSLASDLHGCFLDDDKRLAIVN